MARPYLTRGRAIMRGMEPLSDAALAALVHGAGDAVIVAAPDGAIRYWNAAAEAMFGHAAEDALGASLDIVIPERLRERHWDGFRHTMATGETKYAGETLSVPAIRADGSRISVEFTVALVHDDGGAVSGIAAIMREVTAAFEERRALQRRVRELEDELAALREERPPAPRPAGGEESAGRGAPGREGPAAT
jgi:PAS domain S-box-containing protein